MTLADLVEANKAHLCKANLRGANLRGVNLEEAYLCEANLCEANLCEANLYEANLCGVNLRGANLRGANLYGANLDEADIYEADLWGAHFDKNILRASWGMPLNAKTAFLLLSLKISLPVELAQEMLLNPNFCWTEASRVANQYPDILEALRDAWPEVYRKLCSKKSVEGVK